MFEKFVNSFALQDSKTTNQLVRQTHIITQTPLHITWTGQQHNKTKTNEPNIFKCQMTQTHWAECDVANYLVHPMRVDVMGDNQEHILYTPDFAEWFDQQLHVVHPVVGLDHHDYTLWA